MVSIAPIGASAVVIGTTFCTGVGINITQVGCGAIVTRNAFDASFFCLNAGARTGIGVLDALGRLQVTLDTVAERILRVARAVRADLTWSSKHHCKQCKHCDDDNRSFADHRRWGL